MIQLPQVGSPRRRSPPFIRPRQAKASLRIPAAADARMAELIARVDQIAHDLAIQFTRIAQLQADIDLIRGAWSRVQQKIDR
jgi:hypothetical protein